MIGTKAPKEAVDVLIVGGGGAGLTASMLLARLGVDTLLVSALPYTSDLPKAHVLNQRALEVLEDAGATDEILKRSTPPENMRATAFYSGFAGEGVSDGRRIAKLDAWGAGAQDELWRLASPWHQLNLPQIRLEPVLRARAEELAPGRVRFNHELLDLDQDGEGVTAEVLDKNSGETYVVRCRYLLAADGGRTVSRLVGIDYEGLGTVAQAVTMHVSADLSRWAKDPDVLIRWHMSPEIGGGIAMVPMGPERWGPDSEEWVMHLTYPGADAGEKSDAELETEIRRGLGIGELPMKIHKLTRWSVEAVMASRFSDGRVILLGDAAHRHPPTGALGLNSAIHDAQNICWKLAMVLDGSASPDLLDTYEAERRPSVERNAQRSLENAANHLAMVSAVGVSPEKSADENRAAVAALFSEAPDHAAVRAEALRFMRAQSMEFGELNVEYGYAYESAAVVPDGTPRPETADDVRLYEPSTRPGSPLPHAWISDEAGNRRPIKDLIEPGRFLLIAGEEGAEWCDAANELAKAHSLPLDCVRIGHIDGDLFDPRCMWLRSRGITSEGAVLVRPDRFIGWRSARASDDSVGDLARAVGQIIAQALEAPVVSGAVR